jgi:deoxyribonuclease IV
MYIGAHLSISKGLHNALYKAEEYSCNAVQLFTKNSQTWKERNISDDEIKLFNTAKEKTGITEIASHTSYLINLASPDKKKNHISKEALYNEIIRSSNLGIKYVILHPGSHMGKGEKAGIQLIIENIKKIFEKLPETNNRLLFETTAGQGTGLGHTFEQIRDIIQGIDMSDKIGICLDTCHIFAAGYDIKDEDAYLKTFESFNNIIGIENLYLIHLNDSKKMLGSKVDRHEHIGEGFIGIDAFKYIMNDSKLFHVPKILETPKIKDGKDMDIVNLKRLINLIE